MSCLLNILIASRVHVSGWPTVLIRGLTAIFRRKGFVWRVYFHNSPSLREARARTKIGILRHDVGIKAEIIEEPCLQVCTPWLAQVFGFLFYYYFFTQPSAICLGKSSPTVRWVLSCQALIKKIIKKNAPLTCLQGKLMESFSNGGPLFSVTSLCEAGKP